MLCFIFVIFEFRKNLNKKIRAIILLLELNDIYLMNQLTLINCDTNCS
jgi:hypothetical protein